MTAASTPEEPGPVRAADAGDGGSPGEQDGCRPVDPAPLGRRAAGKGGGSARTPPPQGRDGSGWRLVRDLDAHRKRGETAMRAGSALATAWIVAMAGTSATPTARAQEIAAATGEWEFSVAPYIWAAAIEGTARIGRLPSADISASFGDIVDNLDFAFMGTAEARRDRFSLFGDVVYVTVSDSTATPGPLFSRARVEVESLMATLGAGYAVVETDNATVDLTIAGRYWSERNEIAFGAGALPGRSAEATEVWFDPMIGGVGRYEWDNGVFVSGRALVGGFGIGSDFVFDGVATLGYAFNDTIAASIGFRWLSVDYEDDGFVYDVDQYGPIAGVRIRF